MQDPTKLYEEIKPSPALQLVGHGSSLTDTEFSLNSTTSVVGWPERVDNFPYLLSRVRVLENVCTDQRRHDDRQHHRKISYWAVILLREEVK